MEQELAMMINSYLNEKEAKEVIDKMMAITARFGDDGLSIKTLNKVWSWVVGIFRSFYLI